MSDATLPVRRRTLLQAGLALGASQVIGAPFLIAARGEEPVKIGMVDPLTGVLSALAQSEVDGAKYAEAEINKKGGILGRQVQLLVEDSANDVGTGVQKTRKLIDRDQVDVILGDVNSGIAYAMSQVTNEKKVFHIVPGGHTDPITGTNCKWNVFRVCNTTTMDANAVTPELVKRFGKKWFFITPDYAYGHTLQDAFIKALTKLGGTYDGDYLPINNTDFSATLIKAKAYKPNVLLNNMGGLTQINCMKQFTQFGMQNEMALGGALFEIGKRQGLSAGGANRLVGHGVVVESAHRARSGEIRRRVPRRDQQDALGARLVRLRVDALGPACRRQGEIARGSEAGEGIGGSRTAAGRGATARQSALSRGRSRTDAEYLRRQHASAEGQPRRRVHGLRAGAGRTGRRLGRGHRVQDGATDLIHRIPKQNSPCVIARSAATKQSGSVPQRWIASRRRR